MKNKKEWWSLKYEPTIKVTINDLIIAACLTLADNETKGENGYNVSMT